MSNLNASEIAKISTAPNLRTNPARYDYEEKVAKEAPEQSATPIVTIGPNAAYIVDPGRSLGSNLPSGGEQAPVLSSIDPSELSVSDSDTTTAFVGSGFTEDSEIIWNGSPEPTTFANSSRLTTIVKPSTVEAELPITIQAWIRTGDKESAKLDFTFTEGEESRSKQKHSRDYGHQERRR